MSRPNNHVHRAGLRPQNPSHATSVDGTQQDERLIFPDRNALMEFVARELVNVLMTSLPEGRGENI